jgi:hypothetical protein
MKWRVGAFCVGVGDALCLVFFSVTNDVGFTDEEGLGGWKKIDA